jgi:hypothetical protein
MLLEAGPHAIRAQKALIAEWEELTPARGIDAGIGAFGRAFETDEPARMLGAFVNRKR